MTYEQLVEAIAQYKSSGGDLNQVAGYVLDEISTGKTPLGLNRWQRSDKPVMDDFNEDNRIIDENLRGLWEGKADKTTKNTWRVLEPMNGFTASEPVRYMKDNSGWVQVVGTVIREECPNEDATVFAQLPAGFRPSISVPVYLLSSVPTRGTAVWSTYGWVDTTGKLSFPRMNPDSWSGNRATGFNVVFRAEG